MSGFHTRGWQWRRAAWLLSVAAQLITISALTSADPLPVTWAALCWRSRPRRWPRWPRSRCRSLGWP